MARSGHPGKEEVGRKAQTVRRLLEEGKTCAEIREATGLGYERVKEYLDAIGFPKAFGLVRGIEAAASIGVCPRTFYTYASAGRIERITGYGRPLFRLADVERLKEELQKERHERYRIKHGTYNGRRRGCDCEECEEAFRAYNRRYMRTLQQRNKPPTHGTASGYFNHRCRCELCKLAGSMENKLASLRAKQRSQTA